MRRAKSVAGLLVAALAAWALFELFRRPATTGAPFTFTSSQACRACHAQAYAEWSDSWHARAFTDPEVRDLSNEFRNADCVDCHAPRPVFETGLSARVLPRFARREEGVDCIACHALADGRVAGRHDDPSAPCRPAARPELADPAFCAPCHDQHQTVAQWRASAWAAKGVGCVGCHMPGGSHAMAGGHDLELLRSAVTLSGFRQGEGWVVAIENVGAGHHFPTDERARAADLFWRPIQAGGASAPSGPWRHLYRFRSPYRHETALTDTLLASGERRSIALEDADGRGGVEVALFYKLTPYWTDPARPDPEREARLVHRIELRP